MIARIFIPILLVIVLTDLHVDYHFFRRRYRILGKWLHSSCCLKIHSVFCLKIFYLCCNLYFIFCGVEFGNLSDSHFSFFDAAPELLYRISDRSHCSKSCHYNPSLHIS